MEDCYFESRTMSTQLFADENSRVSLERNNVINVEASTRQEGTVFSYIPGNAKQLSITGTFKILCPPGFGITRHCNCDYKEGVMLCSYFTATCEQCPRRTYSLERGELFNNHTKPVVCQACPKGGNCVNGHVTAKPNFWGNRLNQDVTFLQCPPKYCFDTDHCEHYNSCHGNRIGTLCGKCPTGMSESLLDTKCEPNKDCVGVSFWPGITCYLIVYLIFFLYHEEVFTFILRRLDFRLTAQPQSSKPSRFLKILFYYYQVLHLLRHSVGSRANGEFVDEIENVIARFLNLLVINLPFFGCPLQEFTSSPKGCYTPLLRVCLVGTFGRVVFAQAIAHKG